MEIEKKIVKDDQKNAVEIFGYDIVFGDVAFEVLEINDVDKKVVYEFEPREENSKININNWDEIVFINCSILWNSEYNLRRTLLKFEDCFFKEAIVTGANNNKTKYEFSNYEKVSITLDHQNRIILENNDLILSTSNNGKNFDKRFSIKHKKDKIIYLWHSSGNIGRINGHIKLLNMTSFPDSGNLTSEECSIESFSIDDVITVNNLKINNKSKFYIPDNSKLEMSLVEIGNIAIRGSSLILNVQNMDFLNTDIIFEDNASLNIGELTSVATVWNPSKIKYRGFCPGEKNNKALSVNNILAAQEFFGEMKEYFSRKGNAIVASSFYAAEMKAHRTYLMKKYNRFHHDRLTADWSFFASDFNQNWKLALYWYFVFSLIFAIIFVMPDFLKNIKNINSIDFGIKNFFITLSLFSNYYADILSPVAISFKNFNEDSKNLIIMPSCFVFLWMIWKIMAGYLIYQIATSARRFVRFK